MTSLMHRLFVGIRPPAPVRAQLLDIMGGVPNARWQNDEQLHVTVRFVGQVDGHLAEDLAVALGGVRQAPFDVGIDGVGVFERRGRGTIWAGVTSHADLAALHKKVDQICRRVGIAPDGRAYHPHLTLARFGREVGPIEPFLQLHAGLNSLPFRVEDIRLYESHLGPEGATYEAVAKYPLAWSSDTAGP